MPFHHTPTMQQMLQLIGVDSARTLIGEAQSHPVPPLRRVDELLITALDDVAHGQATMRTRVGAIKQATDREIENLDSGHATSNWPSHYTGRFEAGRRELHHGVDRVRLLAPASAKPC